jgi:hypothetical protein
VAAWYDGVCSVISPPICNLEENASIPRLRRGILRHFPKDVEDGLPK